MRRSTLLFVVALLSVVAGSAADTPHKQLLVFRNTGEVNLFYADSLRSVTLEDNDSLGLCQVFETHGGMCRAIPVAEIDSVAFGSRNKSEIRNGVRILKDDIDIPFIASYDGERIRYNSTVPSDILPTSGELLYYGELTELFPVGVCARVQTVTKVSEGYDVAITTVDPSEIFSHFFYAGDMTDPEVQLMNKMQSRAVGKANLGRITASTSGFSATVSCDVEFTDVVFDVRRHYYHVTCLLKPSQQLKFNLKLDDTETFEEKYMERTFRLSPIAGIFIPSFDVAAFLKIEASLAFKYDLFRQTTIAYEWTRRDGVSTFSRPTLVQGAEVNQAKMQLLLDGTLFGGLEVAGRFGLIGDVAGAGLKINAGPRFQSEIGVGTLMNLAKEYSPELYVKGVLSASLGVDVQPFAYYKRFNQLFGDEYTETPIGNGYSMDLFERKLNLFPEFENTSGRSISPQSVVARSEVSRPIEYPVTVGFAIEENIGDEVETEPLATIFLDEPLDAGNDEPVGLAQNFNLSDIGQHDSFEDTYVRPVFRYHDYTIKAAPSGITGNSFYGFFTHISAGGTQIVGGAFDVRSKTSDKACVLVGNYFPRIKSNPLFAYIGGGGIVTETGVLKDSIVGTWSGRMADEETTLLFRADGSGAHNDAEFRYEVNTPQSGDLRIMYSDSNETATYTIVSISHTELSLKKKGKSAVYTLTRK